MSELVERVARAIAGSKRGIPPDDPETERVMTAYMGQARAAIAEVLDAVERLPANLGPKVRELIGADERQSFAVAYAEAEFRSRIAQFKADALPPRP